MDLNIELCYNVVNKRKEVFVMKLLKNRYDNEIAFENLEEAKHYYLPKEEKPCEESEFLGQDFSSYCKEFNRYKEEISNAETLEELAEILTRYTDNFVNGSEFI